LQRGRGLPLARIIAEEKRDTYLLAAAAESLV
jgi:hypothetical protein